ncbi:hypothetical protein ACFFGH_02095 [Lysobacter korlensis]|uniref:Lipoprotein n=1 Tax=Lysobacter korlensis TaxID=553636 RepID=A0ABV6RJ90_9GAMM
MTTRPGLLLAAALALAACSPAEDPAAQAAAQAAASEQAAEEAAKQFEAEFAKQNWGLARAHGDVLMAKYADTKAAARIKPQYEEAKANADAEREKRRLTGLWTYQTEAVPGGKQLSAAIYAKEPVDTGGSGAQPVRLIFRDHPEWGDSSYLTLEGGDFNCYGGCRVKVTLDEGKPRSMAASRPDTDEAIAMFIEDEKALWKMAQQAEKTLAVEFPVKAGGTRTAVFEVGELQPDKLPGWN